MHTAPELEEGSRRRFGSEFHVDVSDYLILFLLTYLFSSYPPFMALNGV